MNYGRLGVGYMQYVRLIYVISLSGNDREVQCKLKFNYEYRLSVSMAHNGWLKNKTHLLGF